MEKKLVELIDKALTRRSFLLVRELLPQLR